MFVVVSLVSETGSKILHCVVCVGLGATVYGAMLLLMKEKLMKEIAGRMSGKFWR